MKTIIAVSPCYLKAIYEESIKFSFEFVGYGSLKVAYENLNRMNLNDIMGICYSADCLPTLTEREYLGKLLDLLEVCQYSNKIIFLLNSSYRNNLKELSKYSLNISYIDFKDDLTDVYINRGIFANILLHKRNPYILREISQNATIEFDTPALEYTTIMNPNYVFCLSKVNTERELKEVLLTDKFTDYCTKQGLYTCKLLREIWIRKALNMDYTKQYESIMNSDEISIELELIMKIIGEVKYEDFIKTSY